MSERLRHFVLDVSNDPERARRLTADPTAELEQSNLSPEEQEIILSRDPDALRLALGPEHAEMLSMNSFFKEPATIPVEPAGPPERRPRKPRKRAPAKKAPRKKAPAKKRTPKTSKRKGAARRPARKAARKGARKRSRNRSRSRRG